MSLDQEVREYIKVYMNIGFDVRNEHFLTKDIGMDGDDAVDFIDGFSEKFGVDFSDMDMRDHFGGEGFSFPIFRIARSILNRQPIFQEYKDIRVSDLILAAKTGAWKTES